LSVLFSDIAGFTTFSEKMTPEELVLVLNEYMSAMMDIIKRNKGCFDKSIGDAVMAFWGAPIELEDHALKACITALEMQSSIVPLREKWIAEGKPPIRMRIGVNTGQMVVGNMGGADRINYTVMGDSVNLGSRLEGANKLYNTAIMISESTYAKVRDHVLVRELDLLVVKGKTEPIRIYELLGLTSDAIPDTKKKVLRLYADGLALYRNRDFEQAASLFTEAATLDPTDGPSQLYLGRSLLYKETPPPDDWNGVFVMKTK
jgi:adenylate cyclase